ncbi:trehalase-like domain-containing protein [Amycolatopsis sp. GA6-003]|uniref:trehalase-like domain-containing protein n=1 Tax=Amycolatopsis sp. GA6-003 TaxID=2652444 RepID=UPI0039171C9F
MPRSPGVEWSIACDGPQDTATSSLQPTPELPVVLELRHHGSRRAWTVRSGPHGPVSQLDDAESGDHREVPSRPGCRTRCPPSRPTHAPHTESNHLNDAETADPRAAPQPTGLPNSRCLPGGATTALTEFRLLTDALAPANRSPERTRRGRCARATH